MSRIIATELIYVVLISVILFSVSAYQCNSNGSCQRIFCKNQYVCKANETYTLTACGCCVKCVPTIGVSGACKIYQDNETPDSVCAQDLICCNKKCVHNATCESERVPKKKPHLRHKVHA
ncbi:hypothetical protein GWI33_007250 [Rhynchophorus ferrugineus]|uniref:Uncharacterized protein n=1 Tax=Rhynchophorus ferrugineus TaxID=354439 RepID=A0A834ITG0_RHYFE|nr:hypothetical protein GWI33_007250 [Rhynchophorus ferrugineus]